jgi:alpha-1,2-mannosyltransferase
MCFDRRPVFGGWMPGLLCIKPQIGLAVPLILLRRRYRRELLWCLVSAGLMILLSVLVEGWQEWVWFVAVAEPKSALILNAPLARIVPGGFTVLMMARSFHATLPQAWALQAASSAVSAFLIWSRWRRLGDDVVCRMALTMCLSVLMTPYGYIYDLVGFSIGMAAMFERSGARQKPVYALLWLMSGYYITLWNETGYILMPAAAAFGAWMIWHTQPALAPERRDRITDLRKPPVSD